MLQLEPMTERLFTMQIDMTAWLKMHEGQMLFDSRDQDAAMSDIEYFIISWEVSFT